MELIIKMMFCFVMLLLFLLVILVLNCAIWSLIDDVFPEVTYLIEEYLASWVRNILVKIKESEDEESRKI